MKKIVLTLGIAISSMFAIDLGALLISPEAGATLSYSKIEQKTGSSATHFNNKDVLSAGAYARLWVGIAGFMLAPQVKYDYHGTSFNVNHQSQKTSKFDIHNIQYGGVLGYRIPFIKLTPFIGASYSTFKGDLTLEDTCAVNFGVRWEVPLIPFFVIGFEGSWQNPKMQSFQTGKRIEMLNLGGTIGFAF